MLTWLAEVLCNFILGIDGGGTSQSDIGAGEDGDEGGEPERDRAGRCSRRGEEDGEGNGAPSLGEE